MPTSEAAVIIRRKGRTEDKITGSYRRKSKERFRYVSREIEEEVRYENVPKVRNKR